MLCSVVKHAGSGRARKKCRRKRETKSSVFPHFLSALPLPKCFTTEQSTVKAFSRFLYLLYDKESDNFSTHSAEFSNQASKSGVSRVLFSDKARFNKPITIVVRMFK